MTTQSRTGIASQSRKTRRRSGLIPPPEQLALLIRLVNLLPKSVRRSSDNGIHELTMRTWHVGDEEQARISMFYLPRYLRDLPLELEAFVLHDEDGLCVELAEGALPQHDSYHQQIFDNFEFLEKSQETLQKTISTAKERIDIEIKRVEARASSRGSQKGERVKRSLEFRELDYSKVVLDPYRRYELSGRKFGEVGITSLALRARQRFFFLLEAEEILFALATDPEKVLNQLWYLGESGALANYLYVHEDKVKAAVPTLFSFVVGVQVSRVRICEICQDYFWAGRKDKRVCSEKCGANKRKRLERKRYLQIKVGDRVPRKRSPAKQ